MLLLSRIAVAAIIGVCALSGCNKAQGKPAPPASANPTYMVTAKKFIDHGSTYSIQYDLMDGLDTIVAECDDPRPDGTGCGKFQTSQSYVLEKDSSGRFLTDPASSSARLKIDSERSFLDNIGNKTDENDSDNSN